jgi:hypothetical protein
VVRITGTYGRILGFLDLGVDRLCSLVVRVPGHRSRGNPELLDFLSSGSGTASTQPRDYN